MYRHYDNELVLMVALIYAVGLHTCQWCHLIQAVVCKASCFNLSLADKHDFKTGSTYYALLVLLSLDTAV